MQIKVQSVCVFFIFRVIKTPTSFFTSSPSTPIQFPSSQSTWIQFTLSGPTSIHSPFQIHLHKHLHPTFISISFLKPIPTLPKLSSCNSVSIFHSQLHSSYTNLKHININHPMSNPLFPIHFVLTIPGINNHYPSHRTQTNKIDQIQCKDLQPNFQYADT